MPNLGPALLAFLVASGITAIELITSEYADTYFIVYRSLSLYLYSFIYGALALVIVIVGLSHIIMIGNSDPWLQAVIIGVSIQAMMNIRLFSWTKEPGDDPQAIGPEIFVHIFEPKLKLNIQQHETDGLHKFLDPRVKKYTDCAYVKKQIMGNLSRQMNKDDRVVTSFRRDVENALNNPEG